MTLINGLLCLLAAGWLLRILSKVQDVETNQFLQKFVWVYISGLVIIGIHHLTISFFVLSNDTLGRFISGLGPIADTIQAIGGVLLGLYLRTHKQPEHEAS